MINRIIITITIITIYCSGFLATISHIGVKVPVNPPCAHPHPPCCSISWTLYVPDGTSLKVQYV
jgi:hypothetical protein